VRRLRAEEILQERRQDDNLLRVQQGQLQRTEDNQQGQSTMTTLKDINIIREIHEQAAEIYNRRCRRLVALYTAGRKVDDHVILLRTDERRLAYESTLKDMDYVMEFQAQMASMEPVNN
jgi:hypothetical protein